MITNVLEFMSDSPVLTFFIAFLIAIVLTEIAGVCGNTCNRIMRHWNIHKHGYPPPHCDADGDFKTEPKTDAEKAEDE
jgi:hypothetical protein